MGRNKSPRIIKILAAIMVIPQAVFLLAFSSISLALGQTIDTSGGPAYAVTQNTALIVSSVNAETFTSAGDIMLSAIVSQNNASVYFHISGPANLQLPAVFNQSNNDYEILWNASSLPSGQYNVEAIAAFSGQTASNNITVQINNSTSNSTTSASTAPTATYSGTTSPATNTAPTASTADTPIATSTNIASSTSVASAESLPATFAIDGFSYQWNAQHPGLLILLAKTSQTADRLIFKVSGPSTMTLTASNGLINGQYYYNSTWDTNSNPEGAYSIEAVAFKNDLSASKSITLTINSQTRASGTTASSTTTMSAGTSTTTASTQNTTTAPVNETAKTPTIDTKTAVIAPTINMITDNDQAVLYAPTETAQKTQEKIVLPAKAVQTSAAKTEEEPRKISKDLLPYVPLIAPEDQTITVLPSQPNPEDNAPSAEKIIPNIIIIDSDGDGLPDDVEQRIGTNPYVKDTDGDGYDDRNEINNGYNPTGQGKLTNKLAPIDRAFITNAPLEQAKAAGKTRVDAKLKVTKVSNLKSIDVLQGSVTSKNKLQFSGVALANSVATLFIYSSMPIVVTVNTDANGNWVYDLDKTLVDGNHEAYIVINSDNGKVLEKSAPLSFVVKAAQAATHDPNIAANIDVYDPTNEILGYYLAAGAGLTALALAAFFFISKKTNNNA